ncbi:MAG: four-helix bundle copper-binding protein [Nitrospira sp.]
MSDISRRTFVITGASLLAAGASLTMSPGLDAATQHAGQGPMREPQELPNSSLLQMSGETPTMDGHHMSEEMRRCIQLCQDCHAACIQMISHCLKLGGQHAAPDHIRLLMDCAQLCTTTADFMARESLIHDRTCSLCSEICRLCAESCERVAGDDQSVTQCAELCLRCAESCNRMASNKAA